MSRTLLRISPSSTELRPGIRKQNAFTSVLWRSSKRSIQQIIRILPAPYIDLANVYQAQGEYARAERQLIRALSIEEKVLGKNHPTLVMTLQNLGNAYTSQKKFTDAESAFKRALVIGEATLAPNHPRLASAFYNLAIMYRDAGKNSEMLIYSRRATAAVIAYAAGESSDAEQNERMGGVIEQRAHYFRFHSDALWTAAQKGIAPAPQLGREAFEVAQWAGQSSAAGALQQMAVRFAAGNDALAALVRERQDLSAFWRNRNNALVAALARSQSQQQSTEVDVLRKQTADIESKLFANAARLEKDFPNYAVLSNPKPLAIEDVQRLLAADEALVSYMIGESQSYVFAVTHEGFDWRRIGIGAENLSDKVAALRSGLDLEKLQKSASKPALFDLALGHEFSAHRSGRSADQGQATSPRGAVGLAHLASIPFVSNGEAGKAGAADQGHRALPRRRLADQAPGGERATCGREPSSITTVCAPGREHKGNDRFR